MSRNLYVNIRPVIDKLYSKEGKRLREGLKKWVGFWRENPHRFAKDYLGMHWLKPFQQILLYMIVKYKYVMIFASRGFGKTQLVAAAICVKSILYPGLNVVVSSSVRGQSGELLDKILKEFKLRSPNLAREILSDTGASADAGITWKSRSITKVATANENARSKRAHWVICDEFVRIKKHIITAVLKKFKAGKRSPPYLDNPKYADYPQEPNCETYISSATYKNNYSYDRFKLYFKNMMTCQPYITCGFPYQLPVSGGFTSKGYYDREQVIEDMEENGSDEISFIMEMETLFFGESSNSFFSFDSIDSARVVFPAIYPKSYYAFYQDDKIKPTPKMAGEIRLVTMDVAVAGGSRNDNTCYGVLRLIPNKNHYIRYVVYMETLNGGHTADQAIRLKQLYNDFDADYVVIDAVGVGIGVIDHLTRDLYDKERNVTYSPWAYKNNTDKNKKIKKNSPMVIYDIISSEVFNSNMARMMRNNIASKKIRFLTSPEDCVSHFAKSKKFNALESEKQQMFYLPYHQTTALLNEMIGLTYDKNKAAATNKIKLQEAYNKRKDRYTSIGYGNMVADELEQDLLKVKSSSEIISDFSQFKAPNTKAGSHRYESRTTKTRSIAYGGRTSRW